MRKLNRMMILFLILVVGLGCAHAEECVSVTELQQQLPKEWLKGTVVVPEVTKVPVLTIVPDEILPENPYVVTIGTFDENESGAFQNSVRYGRTPAYTELKNGLTFQAACSILDGELNRLLGKSLDDYGLIWTEIAEWKNMETWLLFYGQKIEGLTCFNANLTMDGRTETYRHLIIPHWRAEQTLYSDVPLAPWNAVEKAVEAFLQKKSAAEDVVLELGYLMEEEAKQLVPVWHLSYITSNDYCETYFSAQTAEQIEWVGNHYQLPDVFGWE